MISKKKYENAQKAYLVSLRHKLLKSYEKQSDEAAYSDLRWINGFMAAGYHSGLISLRVLKLECLSAYRQIHAQRMNKSQETQLERRLARLCQEEVKSF